MVNEMDERSARQAFFDRLWVRLNKLFPEYTGSQNGSIARRIAEDDEYEIMLKFLKSDRSLRARVPLVFESFEYDRIQVCIFISWQWRNPQLYAVSPADPIMDARALKKTLFLRKEAEEKEKQRRIRQELLDKLNHRNETDPDIMRQQQAYDYITKQKVEMKPILGTYKPSIPIGSPLK